MLTPTVYRAITALAAPLVRLKLHQRVTIGKEDPQRLHERLGRSRAARPERPLIWFHAVSVGETISILPLIERLAGARPAVEILLTTGTTTSAKMVDGRLPARCRHQFVPVDLPGAVARFYDHWRPNFGVFVESELWPNLVLSAARRGVPLALVNGRMTNRTWHRWQRMPRLIAPILDAFVLILARSRSDAERLKSLGARDVRCLGDLKYAAPPLEIDTAAEVALRGWIGDRPLWLAASTHHGEDEYVADAHLQLKTTRQRLLTIIVPRHPERGADIAPALEAKGLAVARRSEAAPVTNKTDIYLADTVGELGLFYRLADTVFVGGSLVPTGGHNLLEAARLDCAIVHGPHMTNFTDMVAALREADATRSIADGDALAPAIAGLLSDPTERRRLATAAHVVADDKAHVLDDVLDALDPHLNRALGDARA